MPRWELCFSALLHDIQIWWGCWSFRTAQNLLELHMDIKTMIQNSLQIISGKGILMLTWELRFTVFSHGIQIWWGWWSLRSAQNLLGLHRYIWIAISNSLRVILWKGILIPRQKLCFRALLHGIQIWWGCWSFRNAQNLLELHMNIKTIIYHSFQIIWGKGILMLTWELRFTAFWHGVHIWWGCWSFRSARNLLELHMNIKTMIQNSLQIILGKGIMMPRQELCFSALLHGIQIWWGCWSFRTAQNLLELHMNIKTIIQNSLQIISGKGILMLMWELRFTAFSHGIHISWRWWSLRSAQNLLKLHKYI